ncbi:MAG: type 1 glutamine amidotransferase, partial [Ilumatobacteraceae bacterium]
QMAAYEKNQHPWIDGERPTSSEAANAEMPLLGVCLGAQLLARAAGGEARAGAHGAEVGVLAVDLSPDALRDPLFADLSPTITALQWHGDTFDLPPDARLLATSDEYPQAFRIGNAYGLQFHVEVTSAMAQDWSQVPAYAASLDAVLGDDAFPRLLADFEHAQPEMRQAAEAIAHRFVDLITARRAAVAAASGDR